MTKPSPPFLHKLIVGTVATVAGIYVMLDAGKDFEYVRFEPHSKEEMERRKREGVGMSMKTADTMTLDYTPEAKERLRRLIEEKERGSELKEGESESRKR